MLVCVVMLGASQPSLGPQGPARSCVRLGPVDIVLAHNRNLRTSISVLLGVKGWSGSLKHSHFVLSVIALSRVKYLSRLSLIAVSYVRYLSLTMSGMVCSTGARFPRRKGSSLQRSMVWFSWRLPQRQHTMLRRCVESTFFCEMCGGRVGLVTWQNEDLCCR